MITFRYKKESVGKDNVFIYRPVADVYLQTISGSWIEFHPYIDSGADLTMIPLSLGKLLGLTVKQENITQIGGIRGSVPTIYRTAQMRIGTAKFTTHLAWALIEDVPPLLGRADVFDQFHVTFQQDKKVILFD